MPRLYAAAEEYLLTDLEDTSEYLSVQYFTDNAINPCMDSTYRFMEHVIVETMKLHQDIQVCAHVILHGDIQVCVHVILNGYIQVCVHVILHGDIQVCVHVIL